MSADAWQEPPEPLAFPERGIHIWQAKIPAPPSLLERLNAQLSPDEHLHAHRFHKDHDRNSFITSRGLLRTLLGKYLACSPSDVHFVNNQFGKPSLRRPSKRNFNFNVSHSHQRALFAFSGACEIGVDIEFIKNIEDIPKLVNHFFSDKEIAEWRMLTSREQHSAFYSCWTRKESFVKASGQGLSFPLKDFSVSANPEKHHCHVEFASGFQTNLDWMVMDLSVDALYRAAIAYHSTIHDLEFENFSVPGCA